MSKTQFLSPKSQAGQAIVLIVFMIIVLFGVIGLAVDGGIDYYYNAAAERAAASAALAGVIFMPKQFLTTDSIPAAAGNDATDRAVQAAKRNGFTVGVSNVTVTVSRYTDPISGLVQDESLQVKVQRDVPTFFMQVFGISKVTVSRTAVAQYLKPLKLGEPCVFPPGDCHTGSTVSQLGNGGFYFLRTEGWSTDRGQGDAYTPDPNSGCASCPTTDVHSINGNSFTDLADPSLPGRGGYNYTLTVPPGYTAQIQVYNAAFAPDGSSGARTQNFCENWKAPIPAALCSPGKVGCTAPGLAPCNYYMHEDDSAFGSAADFADQTRYSAMQYTILDAPSVFIRSSDSILSQMIVYPVDARNWLPTSAGGTDTGGAAPYYTDSNTGKKITQTYAGNAPSVMTAYHAWMDVGRYTPSNACFPTVVCTPGYESESSLIKYNKKLAAPLGPGTYRLRIDTLNPDGSLPPGTSIAHKGMAVRVLDGGGVTTCGTAATPCTLSALDDLGIFTPIATVAGGFFRVPIFSVPAIYAGLAIGIDVFDPGDINAGGGAVTLGFVDPTTCNLFVAGAVTATVHDLGGQRSNLGTGADTVVGNYPTGSTVSQIVNTGLGGPASQPYNGRWLHFDIPIPSTYAPGAITACDPTGQGYWSLQYSTAAGVQAVDTITVTLNLRGNPAHILKS